MTTRYINSGPSRIVAGMMVVSSVKSGGSTVTDRIKQLIEDADVESFDGLEYRSLSGEYLQIQPSAGWEEGMAGVTVLDGQVWIDGDAVAESAQARRVEALIEAGYSTELAHSQRFGFDQIAAEKILG